MGTINVGVGTSNSGPFTNVYTNTGNNGSSWQEITADLTSYVGQTVYIEYEYTSGSSYTGDLAIDYINITRLGLFLQLV